MGVGKKIANETVDIAGSLVKRGLNDAYSVGKALTKFAFKATFKIAKYTAIFSYMAVKEITKRACEYHQEKKLTKNKTYQHQSGVRYRHVKYNSYFQPNMEAQKKQEIKNVIPFSNQTKRQVAQKTENVKEQVQESVKEQVQENVKKPVQEKKVFQEREMHASNLEQMKTYYQLLSTEDILTPEQKEKAQKVAAMFDVEKEMLEKNKVYKNSEYYANYDYVNDQDKGMKKGVKEAVHHGNMNEFKKEYQTKFEIAKADVVQYYQHIEKSKDPQEKAFWTGRLESYAYEHQDVLKKGGAIKEGIQKSNHQIFNTRKEVTEAKLKKLEELKKGVGIRSKEQEQTKAKATEKTKEQTTGKQSEVEQIRKKREELAKKTDKLFFKMEEERKKVAALLKQARKNMEKDKGKGL